MQNTDSSAEPTLMKGGQAECRGADMPMRRLHSGGFLLLKRKIDNMPDLTYHQDAI